MLVLFFTLSSSLFFPGKGRGDNKRAQGTKMRGRERDKKIKGCRYRRREDKTW